ncbi:hypothetical protein LCGC14_1368000 [marine sediment metagenome]|uniref:Peptidase S74 domain-containing protein n=1 Tax=marine sediment metagenome TaxID=412755 RepID=A0A0F9K6I9_9ZZZZ
MTLPGWGQNIAQFSINLADILDLNIVAPAAGHILIYDGNSWDNQPVSGDITITAAGLVEISPGVIVDADISATAEIAVSKLADGTARQVLETAADGVTVQWTSNVDLPGTLDVTLLATFDTAITLGEGTAQAGTDVYLARDNDGDLTLNALAGKGINLAIAGVDEIQYTTGAMAFQQATVLSTTVGDFTINTADQFIVLVPDEKVSAIKFQNSSVNFYTMDVQTTIQGTVAHQFDNADVELSNVAALSYRQILLRGYILNVTTDADDITAPGPFMLDVGTTTITSDTASTNFTDVVSSVRIAGLSAGTNVIFDNMAVLHIINGGGGGGTETVQHGIFIDDLTVGGSDYGLTLAGADTAAIWVKSADPIQLGTAGTATGNMNWQGATSGVVTMTVAAAAGTWTMTLPTAVGGAGEQLTDAAGNGITSWAAAASLREHKRDIQPWTRPQDALDAILGTRVYQFNYEDGKGTLDTDTRYVGVMADEAPWAMHYDGRIVNPVNMLGYMVLGFQAQETRFSTVEGRVEAVETAMDILRAQVVTLGATPEV